MPASGQRHLAFPHIEEQWQHALKMLSDLADGLQDRRNIQVRPDQDPGRRVVCPDIGKQKGHQQDAVVRADVHPPLPADVEAAVNVPADVAGIVDETGPIFRRTAASTRSAPPNSISLLAVVRRLECARAPLAPGRSGGAAESRRFFSWRSLRPGPLPPYQWVHAPGTAKRDAEGHKARHRLRGID